MQVNPFANAFVRSLRSVTGAPVAAYWASASLGLTTKGPAFCQPYPSPRRHSMFRRTAAKDHTLAPRSTALLGRETGNARLAGFFQPMKPFSCGKALRAPNLRQRM